MGFTSCRYDELKLAEKLGVGVDVLQDAMKETTICNIATVWSVEPVSDTCVKGRISTSKKNKDTGNYDNDFSGFVSFLGTVAAKKAACLKEKDKIKLLRVDVSVKYDKEKNRTYTNYNIFDFEVLHGGKKTDDKPADAMSAVDDGEVETDEDKLPF